MVFRGQAHLFWGHQHQQFLARFQGCTEHACARSSECVTCYPHIRFRLFSLNCHLSSRTLSTRLLDCLRGCIIDGLDFCVPHRGACFFCRWFHKRLQFLSDNFQVGIISTYISVRCFCSYIFTVTTRAHVFNQLPICYCHNGIWFRKHLHWTLD